MRANDYGYSQLRDSNRETLKNLLKRYYLIHCLSSRKMLANYFIAIACFVAISNAENVGWKSYFVENPTEFHDIPLSWESGNQTSVPSWLSGIYVRNGPAQVLISLFDILSIKFLSLTFCQYDYHFKTFSQYPTPFSQN